MAYRLPLYEYLQKNYGDITVCHPGKATLPETATIKEIILESTTIRGFHFQRGLKKLSQNYDIIVGMYDLRWPSIWILPLLLRGNQRVLFWTIGVSTEKGFDVDRKMDFFRFLIGRLAKGIIFYSEYPVEKYLNHNFKKEMLFVACNTIDTKERINLNSRRFEKFLFFGSLSKRKNIYLLIDAFEGLIKVCTGNIYLEIAGDGPEKQGLESYVKSRNLEDRVKFSGLVSGSIEKKNLFENAICTISPGQAGLSVLESFSFGVPFVTGINAVTGGEKFNIIENETGFFITENKTLFQIMTGLLNNETLLRQLSKNCFDHYWGKRKIGDMARGFINAFEYSQTN